MMPAIAMIGFGEAAQAFVSGWRSEGNISGLGRISTFDIKVKYPSHKCMLEEACKSLEVTCAQTPHEAVQNRNAVFSLVTADHALEAATLVSESIDPGSLYFDCNSCSPATKTASSKLIETAGAIYIDVAVMSPVYPNRHKSPLLVSGPAAENACETLTKLGMLARVAGDTVGQASSIKMLRSVMIKGFEALTAECMLAARRAGVEKSVLASLQASDPGIDWTARSAYNLERMMAHGIRRAAEMEEVAATLRELGLPDRMASAAVDWQRQIGTMDLRGTEPSLDVRADAILDHLPR